MADSFVLDDRLAAASLPLAETDLCLIRLMNDRRYPWLLLVPRRAGAVELFDLSADEQHALIDLASALAERMAKTFAADKMNVGTLGNRVSQLHLHVLVRRVGDSAWPDAAWNGTPAEPYLEQERDDMITRVRSCLGPTMAVEHSP